MTDKPYMTLPNGDKLYEGDYGRTRDGRKMGPMTKKHGVWMSPQVVDEYIPMWLDNGTNDFFTVYEDPHYDIIAKWTEAPAQPEAPKLWRDMTPEEKGALLLAHHEGKVIEWFNVDYWETDEDFGPEFYLAYRIRPEPKRETVAICYRAPHGQWREIGTIELIDGKPVIDSVKIEVGDA